MPSPELTKLLTDFSRRSGCVDFVLIEPDSGQTPEYDEHKQATLFTLQVIDRRLAERNLPFRLTFDVDKLHGKKVTLAEFVGPFFDVEKQELVLLSFDNKRFNALCNVPDKYRDTPETKLGYAYAFSFTAHGLSGTSAEIHNLFFKINALLFNEFAAELDIYAWSTDWSNYFDAGHEWIGSFLWTVYNNEQNCIIGIASSTTD